MGNRSRVKQIRFALFVLDFQEIRFTGNARHFLSYTLGRLRVRCTATSVNDLAEYRCCFFLLLYHYVIIYLLSPSISQKIEETKKKIKQEVVRHINS